MYEWDVQKFKSRSKRQATKEKLLRPQRMVARTENKTPSRNLLVATFLKFLVISVITFFTQTNLFCSNVLPHFFAFCKQHVERNECQTYSNIIRTWIVSFRILATNIDFLLRFMRTQ